MERLFTCNLCEAMCGLRVEVDGRRVGAIRGDPDDVVSHGHLCPKAIALGELHEDPDRLRTPRIREGSTWREASWDEALSLASTRLSDTQRSHGRDAVALYVGNPAVHAHRSSFASQLLTAAIGSRHRFDPNSQDSNPRLFACMQVYGDALSIPIPDVDRTDLLIMLGANPAASNGSQMVMGDPKKRLQGIISRGGQIVVVDPRRTETVAWGAEHVSIRPGGDAALVAAMLHVLFAEGRVNRARLASVANGVEELESLVADFRPDRVASAIDVSAATIVSLARRLSDAKRACLYARVGVCQNEFGPTASWLVEAINVVTGNFDGVGGMMFPTPAVDIAPLGRRLIGNHYGRWRSRVRGLPEFLGALPSAVMAEEMETPGEGQIRSLVTFAGNPVLTTPNGPRLERAIAGLDFVVAIDFYVNETTRHAHVILPPKHVFETGNYDVVLSRFGVRNTMKYSAPIVESRDDARDDWQIAVELALRLRAPRWSHAAGRRFAADLPEQAIDWLLATGPRRTSLDALAQAPHGVDFGALVPCRARYVHTRDGRVRLTPSALTADVPRLHRWIDDARSSDQLVLIGRRHLRSNNSWMHNVRSLAKGPDRARLLVCAVDAARLKLVNGGKARVTSRVGAVEVLVTISDEMTPGVVSLPHGFGHGAVRDTLRLAGALPGPSANALTDEAFIEPVLGTSILNGTPVRVEG
ncbi:MAG: molybdopterin-dependent oxidoreductase [Polyangiales bacterium]